MFSLYKKELQSYFLSPIAYFVIAFFMATFSLTFIQEIGNVSSSTYTFSFSSIFYVNIFYFIFLLPLLTMRTFSEERKNGTETLLLSSPLNVTQIVMAKFLATATILLIMLAASLFYPIITSIYGRVIWSSLICTYIGFFLFGLVCIALGIFISSLTEMPLLHPYSDMGQSGRWNVLHCRSCSPSAGIHPVGICTSACPEFWYGNPAVR